MKQEPLFSHVLAWKKRVVFYKDIGDFSGPVMHEDGSHPAAPRRNNLSIQNPDYW
jgi:hypothetical protein